jgi:hypothetical protein
VQLQLGYQPGWQHQHPTASVCLWRPDEMTAAFRLLALKPDVHRAVQQVKVATGERKQLAAAETPEGSEEHERSKLRLDRVG